MKTLLAAINAKYIHSNLAVYSLKAYAKERGLDTAWREFTINQYEEDILREIYEEQADIVAFSCYIWNIDMVLSLTRELKKVSPETKIWLGGPEVSYDAKDVLENHGEIDLVMIGEGEETFYRLLVCEDSEEEYHNVKGIVYRKEDGEIVMNESSLPMDMDEIPFVYEDMEEFQNKIIYYETSRGCPFSCSYCLSSIDKKVRFRSFDLVEKELQFFLDNQLKQVKFVDRTFNCKKSHSMKIWTYLRDHDNGITNFHFEVSADLLDEDELALFRTMRPGLIQLEIGVQSTYEKTIKEIDRTMDLLDLSKVVGKINDMENIHQHLDLIVGLPYENFKRFQKSFNDVHALKPNQLQLGFLKVLKGSKMYQNREAYEIAYWAHTPYEVLSTKWINFDEVLALKAVEEMVEVYYNSDQFRYSLEYLLHFWETPFDFYQGLANHYKENDLLDRAHTRLARYEILRTYGIQQPGVEEEALNNTLLYDMYLREKMKSRPAWAKDISLYKKQYNRFYKTKEISAGYFPEDEVYDSKLASKRTHIDLFTADAVKTSRSGKLVPAEQFVLFDYDRRDPLTYDAKTIWIKELDVL